MYGQYLSALLFSDLQRQSYVTGDYTCHFVSSQDIITLAVTPRDDPVEVFSFLDNVHGKFISYFEDRLSSAVALAMNNEFR